MKYLTLLLLISLVVLTPAVFRAEAASGQSLLQGAHGDAKLMPKSCRACHRGMRMAITGEESACLACHGDDQGRSLMISRGYLARGVALADIGSVLNKPYRHPVLTVRNIHRQRETLPEDEVYASRHSECVDCHNPHLVSAENPFSGIVGRNIGNLVAEIDAEYQLCYLCHSDSQNLPGDSTNKHSEFKTTNKSYHPVEGEGASAFVVSLKEPYAERKEQPGDISVISCSSCHGNDDPEGPAGVHGSNYEGLLRFHYSKEDNFSESEFAYQLCYECHERDSILGNDSFPYHALHIVGPNRHDGTSCYTCHDAHGSAQYASLIRFNEDVVKPTASGLLKFETVAGNSRNGSCSLTCHGVEHDGREY